MTFDDLEWIREQWDGKLSIKGIQTVEDAKIAAFLKKNRVDTIVGKVRFDGPNNYGDDLNRIKQLQNGKW
jgi:branched-chain amino acid transport system substrate-binding protein